MALPVKPINEIEEKSEVSVNDKILILDSESEEARLASKDELKGDKWDKGDTWETWPQWPQGIQGIQWPKGDKWDTWAKGDKWDTWDTWPTWPKWDKWDKWDTWDKGDKGDKGDTWNTWPTWPQGEKWDAFTYDDFTPEQLAALTWPKGDKWDKGDTWDKGDKWDTGASIISASFVNTDLVFSKDDSTDVVLEWAKTTLTWPQWPKWDTGNTWPKWDTGASIVQAWFSGDDMVFTKDDSTSVTIENAKPTLKGDKWDTGSKGDTWNWISSVTTSKSWKTTTVTMNYTSWNPTVFQVQDGADGEWSWDMSMSTYDPTGKMSDAFDYTNMYNKPDIPTKVSDLQNDSEFITKAVNNLTNYYTKTQTYTKTEVENLISNFGGFKKVSVLPTTDIKTNIIYLLWPIWTWPDKYEEYIYDNGWVKIWETTVDLTNYFNKENDTTDNITEWTKKFVTTTEKNTWSWKQDAISDLTTIRSNASAWKTAKDTIDTYWNIVTHNASEFATSTQWWKADTAVQPWDLADIATSWALEDATGTSDDITQWSTNLFLTAWERTKLSNTSWTNSWDETASSIKTKLWITTLSWSNTWDETTTTIKTKLWAATSSADWYLKSTDFATFNWKQEALVSGTNIKTINNTSVLWTWNIAVQATLVSGTNIKTVNSTSLLGSWNIAVQPTLVSWTNIKTINWKSILGSWNITVSSSTTITVTLTSAWWSSKSQTVSATGVTASNTVIVSPAPSDIADYADCGVYCSAQGSGTLTFGCDKAPSGDIVVNVLIMS